MLMNMLWGAVCVTALAALISQVLLHRKGDDIGVAPRWARTLFYVATAMSLCAALFVLARWGSWTAQQSEGLFVGTSLALMTAYLLCTVFAHRSRRIDADARDGDAVARPRA